MKAHFGQLSHQIESEIETVYGSVTAIETVDEEPVAILMVVEIMAEVVEILAEVVENMAEVVEILAEVVLIITEVE